MTEFKSYIKNADCFDEFKNISKKSIDMVLVDLPYGQTDNKWDIVIDLNNMWIELKKICKDRCIYVFFTTTKYGNDLINSNKKWFRYDLIWQKSRSVGFFNSKKQPLRAHEMIYIFYKKTGTYNPQKTKGKPYKQPRRIHKDNTNYIREGRVYYNPPIDNKGDRYPISIIKFKNPYRTIHSTQKPTDLCEWLIKTYSNENDIILDFTMGSGSTIEACIGTNRNYIGIEKDKDIYLLAKDRLDL